MNSEECRLRSFAQWCNSAPECISNLAANGFFATGNSYEIKCYWCGCRFSDWTMNNSIDERHLSASPNCEFIINRHGCGNVPLSVAIRQCHDNSEANESDNASAVKIDSSLDLLTEKDRLATFVNWPNPNITPESLAKAGFFYLNRSDEVQCAWCKGVIARWEKQDNAFEEHRRFFPDCPRVQLGPLIEIANDGIRELGIQQISLPKNPKYTSLHARLQTYSNWPIPEIQKPEDLAQAGLYYQKVDDQVKCFHCNMGLRSWEKQDDPWFEHAKWYPMCEFVRLVKGINYIQEVQELTRHAETPYNHAPNTATEEAMLTEPVRQALNLGLNAEKLRCATNQKIIKSGRPYETLDELLEAIFGAQDIVNTCLSNEHKFHKSPHDLSNTNSAEARINNPSDTPKSDATKKDLSIPAMSVSNSKTDLKEHCKKDSKIKLEDTSSINEKLALDRKYLEEENRKLKDARLCKVCLDEEVGVVYLPCGHLVTCVQCAPGVNQCPMCRSKIKGFVRTYLS